MKIDPIYKRVSEETGIQEDVIKAAYNSFWKFIRKTISALPLKEDLSEEEFKRLRTNFNIPSLGKLCCTYDRFLGMKKRHEYLKKLMQDDKDKKDNSDVH